MDINTNICYISLCIPFVSKSIIDTLCNSSGIIFQLSPIERYAVALMEAQMDPDMMEELDFTVVSSKVDNITFCK